MYSTRIGIVAITTTAVKAGQFVWNRPRNWASPSGSVQWLRSWRSTRWKHPIVTGMADDELHELSLRLRIDSDEERDALEQAVLRARATELAEVRRNQVRLGAGYGDTTTRDAMTAEAVRAALRHAMLDRLLAAIRGTAADETSR